MKLIDKHLQKSILAAIGLVTLTLCGLQIFILFVSQLNEIGKAEYHLLQAVNFVLLQMPYQVYLFFPMASLLGVLIGLSILANHRELVVMRAAGMSIGQISGSVVKAALIVILLVTTLGETLVPKLAYYANNFKLKATSGGQALRTATGVWLRIGNDFIHISSVLTNQTLENVTQFHFDNQQNMQFARDIEKVVLEKGTWQAFGVVETYLKDNKTETKSLPQIKWDITIEPSLLHASAKEADELTLWQLWHHLQQQQKNHQNTTAFQLAYWQRLIQPFTTIVMMLLAIPFIFGPLRATTMGAKLITGTAIGFSFYILNRFLGPLSQVLQWPPMVVAIGPTLLFALLGIYLMRRAL